MASDLLFAANTVATWTTGAGEGWTSRVIHEPRRDIAEIESSRRGELQRHHASGAPARGSCRWLHSGDVKRSTDAAHRADQPRSLGSRQQSVNLSWTNTSTTQTGVKIERSTDNVTFTQITVAGPPQSATRTPA